jgi:hypothetical protein
LLQEAVAVLLHQDRVILEDQAVVVLGEVLALFKD